MSVIPTQKLNYQKSLFFLLIFIEIVFTFIFIKEAHFPSLSDGFQYFLLQYNFLNNAVVAGEIPQWLYTETGGSVSSLYYVLQASLLQNILCLFPFFVKKMNFIVLFHLGFLLDKIILITGTWLLAKRIFQSTAAIFFMTMTITATAIWMTQPWFNFHLYYALPLILYLLHTFFETGHWKYFFLSQNLVFIQLLGNPPYFFPITTLVITLYFVIYFVMWPKRFKEEVLKIQLTWHHILWIFIFLLPFVALWTNLKFGIDKLTIPGRNPDGTITLENFLNYGKNLSIIHEGRDLIKWIGLFIEQPPDADSTVFLGFLALPFLIIALILSPRKEKFHLGIVIFFLLMISFGTIFSIIVYHFWPFMKFYRHLSLLSSLIKIFLCFLIGLGIDTIRMDKPYLNHPTRFMFVLFIATGDLTPENCTTCK